jgi:hypothetical protein
LLGETCPAQASAAFVTGIRPDILVENDRLSASMMRRFGPMRSMHSVGHVYHMEVAPFASAVEICKSAGPAAVSCIVPHHFLVPM